MDGEIWTAEAGELADSNISRLMRDAGVSSYEELHQWSVQHREEFWRRAIDALTIPFDQPAEQILDPHSTAEDPRWLVGARWNVAKACLAGAADAVAIRAGGTSRASGPGGAEVPDAIQQYSVADLDRWSDNIAASLDAVGIQPGDSVAILMPMHATAVAALLGILKCGAVAVGIAESFSPQEIEVRLRLSEARLVLVQAEIVHGAKSHSLYSRLASISAPPAIVIEERVKQEALRDGDTVWGDFLVEPQADWAPVSRGPDDLIGILFSSGTTGDPKVIPWTNLCSLKCAIDAHYHHDTRPDDCLAWPTSLGWMMGPWLIFASLMNRASMALFDGLATEEPFGKFIEHAKVTMLGVVPSLVSAWRQSRCLEAADWSAIRMFSSTGECSNADDMSWLMTAAGRRTSNLVKPVIEYCGGTEIAGGYITGTMHRPCRAATFNTPALGLDVVTLDEAGQPARQGEMYIVPPSIGLSTRLLNRDHREVYFSDCPAGPSGEVLRRHGDEMEDLGEGYYRAHGRCDDTMNLGGIKVSSAEIERAISSSNADGIGAVCELAAVAEAPVGGGPSQLVIYAVLKPAASVDAADLLRQMQQAVRSQLNPLFKIQRIELIDRLPRTASNKVMRRQLRVSR